METMPNAAEFRARARAQFNGSIFSNKWMLLLVVFLIQTAIMGVVSFTFIGTLLITGPLAVGIAAILLKQVRGSNETEVNIADMFYGITNKFGTGVLLGLLSNLFIFFWSLLFVIPGIVKTYAYAMSYYVSLDRPELDANQCITESRRLMDGNKWRLFCLDFSFIGWHIVAILTFGIAEFWIAPYQALARANFYDELVSREVEA